MGYIGRELRWMGSRLFGESKRAALVLHQQYWMWGRTRTQLLYCLGGILFLSADGYKEERSLSVRT